MWIVCVENGWYIVVLKMIFICILLKLIVYFIDKSIYVWGIVVWVIGIGNVCRWCILF